MSRPVFNKSHVYRIAVDAMFVAIFVLLSTVLSFETPLFKFSWTSLPILLCAFLMRPADTVAVALLGSFLDQMFYGLNAQALFFMLPFVLFAAVASLLANTFCRNESPWKIVVALVLSELVLTVFNTLSLYYCGYILTDVTEPALLLWAFLLRILKALPRIVLSALFIPELLKPLRRVLSGGRS